MAAEELGHPEPIQLGNFYANEVPDPILYQFQNYDGTTKDLASATDVSFVVEKDGGAGALAGGTAELVPSNELPAGETIQGWVRYSWVVADMAFPGHYEALFWVTTPTNRFASKLITWYVGDGPYI